MVASAGDDGTVRFWQPKIGRLVRFARLPSRPTALAWTADGAKILVTCRDGRLRVVYPETVAIVADYAAISGCPYCLSVSPDGKVVLVAGEHGQAIKIDLDG
jgi:WD40 repeat protein